MNHRSIRVTMGLIFVTLMLLGGLSVGSSLWTTRAQQHDALVMNLIGRQRMLSQKAVKETWLGLQKGQAPRYLAKMHATAHDFEEGLQVLMDGGQPTYAGTTVSVPPATDPSFRASLEEVWVVWEPLHKAAHTVLESEPGSPAFTQGLADLERLSNVILEKVDEAVRLRQAVAEARVTRLQWIQLAFLLAGAAVLAVGYRLILIQVLQPVSALETTVQRMEKGDLDYPIQVRVRNELGRLAQAFDDTRAQVKARIQEQTALLHLSQTLLGLLEPEAIARATFAAISQHLQPDAISLLAPDAGGSHLELIAGRGWTEEHVGRLCLPLDPPESSGVAWAVHTRKPIFRDHTREDLPAVTPEVVRQAVVQTSLIVPMLAEERGIGVLVLDSLTHRTFSDDEVRFLMLVANRAASALERAREHQGVKEAEVRYRSLFDDVPVGLYRTTPGGQIVDANPAMVEMLGYPNREALLAVNAADLWAHREERTQWQTLLEREGTVRSFEMQARRRDGTLIWVQIDARAVRDEEGRVLRYEGAVEDISARRQAEEEKEKIRAQLFQAQNMEALGILAGGVAHDFNNMLTVIRGHSDLALRKLPEDNPALHHLTEVRRTSVRAADLTRQLLLFSRRQPVDFNPLDLNKVVSDLLKMLDRLIGEHFSIITDLAADLWTVNADPGHIEQVIMNLMVNARDAMPEGGEITIQTKNVHVDEEYYKAHCHIDPGKPVRLPGKFVCLSVRDAGTGMDRATMSRIFEPFFSTKGPGKGTGLGLAVVYGIVTQHEGWISVESTPGHGSTFRIYLPATSQEPEEEQESSSVEEYQGRGERILLVEDEEAVKAAAESMLRENGYVVFVAGSAEEAFDVFEREGGDFDLVFSDVVLPDESGIEVVDQLLARKPGLRILLVSGYSDETTGWRIIQDKGYRFLQKPYALSDLLRVIREVLE